MCAGGTFGEMGFFLRTPQAFRAVAREPCHLHTLDRVGMAAMQVNRCVVGARYTGVRFLDICGFFA